MPTLFVYTLAAGAAFLMSFLCIAGIRPANRVAVRWFGLFLLALGSALLGHIAWQGRYDQAYPYLIPITELTRLTLAPALYLSVWHFVNPRPLRSAIVGLHLVPALVFGLSIAPFFLNEIRGANLSFGLVSSGLMSLVGRLVSPLLKLQLVAYLALSFWLLHRHRLNLRLLTANVKGQQLHWLTGLLLAVVGMSLFWLSQDFLPLGFGREGAGYGYLIGIYGLSYCLFTQSEVFAYSLPQKEAIQALLTDDVNPVVSQSRRLAPDEVARLKQELDWVMEQEKLFMRADLDLTSLAQRLTVSLNDLSYVINVGYGINFFGLINRYRIDEAKRLLVSPAQRNLSILGIAYEVGFTSKSTFNTAFKKYTGQTPSDYVKAAKSSENTSERTHLDDSRS